MEQESSEALNMKQKKDAPIIIDPLKSIYLRNSGLAKHIRAEEDNWVCEGGIEGKSDDNG